MQGLGGAPKSNYYLSQSKYCVRQSTYGNITLTNHVSWERTVSLPLLVKSISIQKFFMIMMHKIMRPFSQTVFQTKPVKRHERGPLSLCREGHCQEPNNRVKWERVMCESRVVPKSILEYTPKQTQPCKWMVFLLLMNIIHVMNTIFTFITAIIYKMMRIFNEL